MTEHWVPVVFAAVIVLGIVTGQVWHSFLKEGLPAVGDLFGRRRAEDEAAQRSGDTLDRAREIDDRVDALEERVQFLEALLEDRRPVPARSERAQPDRRGPGEA